MKQPIYLDYAATTPLDVRVLEEMQPYFLESFGNPSSVHHYGRMAKQALTRAKQHIASVIGARPDEIVFTSGGTEGNNLAILGTCEAMASEGKHVITTEIEHHSVLRTFEALEKKGFKVTYLKPNVQGQISFESVQDALRPDTILVSIMYGNNETGAIQPMQEIAELLAHHPAYFHTDAVQAFGSEDIDVTRLAVDLLTMSGHKIHGPKGIGFLYIREKTKLSPILFGGSQQNKRRPGTENIPAIIGLAAACRYNQEEKVSTNAHVIKLREMFLSGLEGKGISYQVNGSDSNGLPHILNIYLKDISLSSFLANMDLTGVCISGGSACTAGSLQGSHVLQAMYGEEASQVLSSVRISFGKTTTEDEVEQALEKLEQVLAHSKSSKG